MHKNIFLIFLSLLIGFSSLSQNTSKAEIYSWYDDQTGIENSVLFRGVEYVEKDRMINDKQKFFNSDKYQKGWVIYDGQLFDDVSLKFNIYDDVLMVNVQQGEKNLFYQLFSDQVDYFQIQDHTFKYLEAGNDAGIQGFYEVISEDKAFKIFKKHIKDRKEKRDKSLAYIEFTTAKPDFIFQYNQEIFDLDNRRDLFSRFPNLKKEIKDFYRDYRKLSRDKPEAFMVKLAQKMNSLLLYTSNAIDE
ncbi:hypothetical protein G3567_11265 [Psychroflexus sp. YR1-1]|uniref:DUF4369 domain-containing protein n=1 Tax=Psychroflexus aurantiacus TaxID=2709310 RepID=A0A6B3R2D1_9FLAO|nr:hypothetical protein [Psychroflexus aurantiacus]NEV94723.1 hypothetical protein [Psychroflexus aurantiacus]